MKWEPIEAPSGLAPPGPITVRARTIPARGEFAAHAHRWHQIVCATSGVLTVSVAGRSFAISPELAVWLPTGVQQRVGSLLGAQFCSLWVADDAGHAVAERPTVDGAKDDDGYAGRAASSPGKAPWSVSAKPSTPIRRIIAHREERGRELELSAQTLARRFETGIGNGSAVLAAPSAPVQGRRAAA